MNDTDTSPEPHRIDVHHHILPDFYIEALARNGIVSGGGRPFPKWSEAGMRAVMERNGIAKAVVSISAPGVYLGDRADAIDLARRCNEYIAELRTKDPARIGGFAILPLPDTDAALREIEYALDTLRLDGVVLLTAIHGGLRPANPRFAEVYRELDRRGAIVFLHPDTSAGEFDPATELPPFVVDFVYETTRAVAELIYFGVCARNPNVRFILSHAGGTLPYIAWRLSQLEKSPEYRDNIPDGVMTYLKRFYYDTALSASRYALGCLMELAGPTQILFGSDFAFVPESVVAATTRRVGEYFASDDAVRKRIERGNALELFRTD